MISHSIIVNKPKVHYGSTYLVGYKRINSQEELNKHIFEHPLNEGMFIKFKRTDKIHGTYNIHYVIGIERNFDKINHVWDCGYPKVFYIASIHKPDTGDIWKRWDSGMDMQELTKEEYDEWVLPINDLVQNNIKQWKSEFQS